MSSKDLSVVLVHGAWADGSSWSKIIAPLAAEGIAALAAQLPLTSFQDDVAALDRALERAPGPVVLAGHAYTGAVIAATRSDKVKALVMLTSVQRPISPACITVPVPRPLWKDRPAWFLVAEQDRMIVQDNQRFMAERMQARLRSYPVDHTPMCLLQTAKYSLSRLLRGVVS